MGSKALRICLGISLMVNIGGIIYFFEYLNAVGHLKTEQQERSILQNNLAFAETKNVVTDVSSTEKVARYPFISHFDGIGDTFAMEPITLPTHTKSATLFVYLHGMGHTCREPFEYPKDGPLADAIVARDHTYLVVAPNFRSPAGWATSATMSDITQNIRQVCQQFPVKNIVIVGSSMGGCVALSYCSLAPKDIKDLIEGVVCIEGSGDLAKLYHLTTFADARRTLIDAYGGTPDQVSVAYAANSMMQNLSGAPGRARFAIISATQDKIVPPELQEDVYKELSVHQRPVKMFKVEMGHGMPALPVVMQAIDYVLNAKS